MSSVAGRSSRDKNMPAVSEGTLEVFTKVFGGEEVECRGGTF